MKPLDYLIVPFGHSVLEINYTNYHPAGKLVGGLVLFTKKFFQNIHMEVKKYFWLRQDRKTNLRVFELMKERNEQFTEEDVRRCNWANAKVHLFEL